MAGPVFCVLDLSHFGHLQKVAEKTHTTFWSKHFLSDKFTTFPTLGLTRWSIPAADVSVFQSNSPKTRVGRNTNQFFVLKIAARNSNNNNDEKNSSESTDSLLLASPQSKLKILPSWKKIGFFVIKNRRQRRTRARLPLHPKRRIRTFSVSNCFGFIILGLRW